MAEIFVDEGLDFILSVFPKNGANSGTLYLGLFTSQTASTVPANTAVLGATPTGITETTYTNYARQAIAAASWGANAALTTPVVGRKTTAAQVSFPAVGAVPGGAINGFFLASALTAGVLIFAANFDDTTAITPAIGDIIRVTPTLGFGG